MFKEHNLLFHAREPRFESSQRQIKFSGRKLTEMFKHKLKKNIPYIKTSLDIPYHHLFL